MSFSWKSKNRGSNIYTALDQDEVLEPGVTNANGSVIVIKQSPPRKGLMFSMMFNGALLALLAVVIYTRGYLWPTPRGLLNTPVPEFAKEVKTFALDPLYLSLPSHESNEAWEALPGPNGRGFINLEDPSHYGFPDKKAGLSVFHQLHCLGALRKFMWDLVYDRKDREELLRDWPENVTHPTYQGAIMGLWHIAHCFDYLRQGLQCSADTSLEFVTENTGLAVVDGLDYPHECKKWDDVWEYAARYG